MIWFLKLLFRSLCGRTIEFNTITSDGMFTLQPVEIQNIFLLKHTSTLFTHLLTKILRCMDFMLLLLCYSAKYMISKLKWHPCKMPLNKIMQLLLRIFGRRSPLSVRNLISTFILDEYCSIRNGLVVVTWWTYFSFFFPRQCPLFRTGARTCTWRSPFLCSSRHHWHVRRW